VLCYNRPSTEPIPVAGSVPTRHGRRASWDLLQPERITSAPVVRRPSAEKMSDSAESKSRSPSPSFCPPRSVARSEGRGSKQQGSSSSKSRQGEYAYSYGTMHSRAFATSCRHAAACKNYYVAHQHCIIFTRLCRFYLAAGVSGEAGSKQH
jgi:hypothetical protein